MIPLLLAVLLVPPAASQEQPPKAPAVRAAAPVEPARPGAASARNFRISFTIRSGALEASGNFVAAADTQANYVAGGETPFELPGKNGPSVEYRKHSTIVNCLPFADPLHEDRASVQCQFELSGPGEPVGESRARAVHTFQYQGDFSVRLSRPLVLVDEPKRRVELRVDEVK